MHVLHKVLAIIALLILVTNTAGIAYHQWIEAPASKLDTINSTLGLGKVTPALRIQMESARTVDDLIALYKPVREQVEEAKAAKREDPVLETSASALEGTINEWESDSRKLRELRFYWFVGFAVYVAGSLVYRLWNRWFGTALLIVAFFEFIYWTIADDAPTYTWVRIAPFKRLLNNELAYSAVSLVLLLLTIVLLRIFGHESRARATEAGPSPK